MSDLQLPDRKWKRNFLRVAGVLFVVIGLIFLIFALYWFFRVSSDPGTAVPPAFIYIYIVAPSFAVGGVLCLSGFFMCRFGFKSNDGTPRVASPTTN